MNPAVLSEYLPLFLEAAGLTVRIAAVGIVGATLLGLLCALIGYFHIPVLRQLMGIYIELSRNTPLLIQLFFLYYGLPKVGIVLSGEVSAVIGLTFLGGSYMGEAFRSGIDAVGKPQLESAYSLGLTRTQTVNRVVLPQAVAAASPALVANVIFLIKETSVFSIVALPDLMNVAKNLIGRDYNTIEALFLLVVSYLTILLPVSVIGTWLERRWRHGLVGN